MLAAEKPPDIPGLEFTNNDVFINNEDLLFDTVLPYHPRIDTQTENDIIIIEDIIDTPLDRTMDVREISKTDETSRDPSLITESKLVSVFSPGYILG